MKILLTGSRGFVGQHLLPRLRSENHKVFEVDEKLGLNMTDWGTLKAIQKFDILIHLAARTFIPDSLINARQFYYENIISMVNALELCRLNHAKMIYASSYVYGNTNSIPITEDHPTLALNPYTESKLICENLCKAYNRDFGVPSIIFRPFNIYGPGQNKKFLIPTIIDQLNSNEIHLMDRRPARDYLYVEDLVDAFIKAITFRTKGLEIFNIASGKCYSVEQVVSIIIQCSGSNPVINYSNNQRHGEVVSTVADISKARTKLKWLPKISLKEGINKLFEA